MSALIHYLCVDNLISANKAAEIASAFEEKFLLKNEYLLAAGHINDQYFFLEEGFIRAFTFDPEGDEITTAFFSKNNMVFEVSSFFNRTSSRETLIALTDSKGSFITYDQLQVLFHAIPEFREFGRSVLVSGYVSLKERMLSLVNETAEQRYTKLVHENPEIFQYASLKSISTYLGITDTSLSRIRNHYAKQHNT